VAASLEVATVLLQCGDLTRDWKSRYYQLSWS